VNFKKHFIQKIIAFFIGLIFNPNPHWLWTKRSFKKQNYVLDGIVKYFIYLFFYIKNVSQNIAANFFVSWVFHKNVIFNKLFMMV
jgi:hypothetical protein